MLKDPFYLHFYRSNRIARIFNHSIQRYLCRAGQPDVPFEEANARNPDWKQTVLEQSPFAGEIPSEMVPRPPDELPFFFHFDLFHVGT